MLSAELLYLWCSLSALCQLKSLQRYWVNTAEVTSGLKFPLGFGAGVGMQHGRWVLLHFHRILLLQVSCHALGAVASRENWLKSHWAHWSGFPKSMLYPWQRGILCALAWKRENLNEISFTTLLLKLWVFILGERYQERDPHLGLCELSEWGAQAQRKQCRQSKQWTFQILALFVSWLSWGRV